MPLSDPATLILLYFTLPVWYAAGFFDWVCHRRSKIELTSGLWESALHVVMFCEIGLGLLPGLFLEINSLVLILMIAMFALHEATAFLDVSFAVSNRNVTPAEHHIHSFLEIIPMMAIASVAALHWGQFLAIFGLGDDLAKFNIEWKAQPLPAIYLSWTMAVIFIFHFLTYSEELLRCFRARGWKWS
jgi:hypothetical protein